MITKRIDYELDRRIIQTYLKESFSWGGLSGQRVNNWNVWINTNVFMTTILTVEQNKTSEVINKIIKSVDDWINWYGDDGGCDEGPGYWYQAAGRFIQFLFYMTSASNHQIDFSKDKLFNSIGSYIYKMHIDGEYFVNFADAHPRQITDPSLVYLYGQMFNNTDMKEFAAFLYHLNTKYLVSKDLAGTLHLYNIQMSSLQSLIKTTPKAPQPLESWFPDLQVVTLRSQKGSAKGLFLGAKAGTNGLLFDINYVFE